MAISKTGSAKRYGTRYGRSLRERVGKIEKIQRSKHTCPKCKYKQVERLAASIWQCKKCNVKFASGAYAPSAKVSREVQ